MVGILSTHPRASLRILCSGGRRWLGGHGVAEHAEGLSVWFVCSGLLNSLFIPKAGVGEISELIVFVSGLRKSRPFCSLCFKSYDKKIKVVEDSFPVVPVTWLMWNAFRLKTNSGNAVWFFVFECVGHG